LTSYTRNDLWRIKRSAKHLEKALDAIARAGGELRPKQFDSLRATLEAITTKAEALHKSMEQATTQAIAEAAKPGSKTLDLNLDDDEQAEAAQ
jgi:hypothetical protein